MTIKAKRNSIASTLVNLRVRYALSKAALAKLLGVDESTLTNWEANVPTSALVTKIKKVEKILDGLVRVMKKAYIPTWLTTANDACDGRTPADCLQDGDYETIEDLVYFLQAGEPV